MAQIPTVQALRSFPTALDLLKQTVIQALSHCGQKTYPGNRLQTVWGSGRIVYDDDDDEDDEDDEDDDDVGSL